MASHKDIPDRERIKKYLEEVFSFEMALLNSQIQNLENRIEDLMKQRKYIKTKLDNIPTKIGRATNEDIAAWKYLIDDGPARSEVAAPIDATEP